MYYFIRKIVKLCQAGKLLQTGSINQFYVKIGLMKFKLVSDFKPTGDQPQAIEKLTQGTLKELQETKFYLGVTGSGKTFTMANVIEKVQKPTLIISHNKTLAAQLYQEFRDFFPHNAVSYFVSYYDYYQPEAYIPQSDTYIEKEVEINEEIDKLRLGRHHQSFDQERCDRCGHLFPASTTLVPLLSTENLSWN